MICDKYEVELCIYSIEEYGQKVTVTKITANNDDPKVFIEDENLDQLKIDNSKKTVGVVNYMRHFVPLLSRISEDITKSQPVSNEEILGTDKRVPTSDQSEQPIRQESSASESVDTNRRTLISNQSEKKPLKERADRSVDESNSQNHEAIAEGTHSKPYKNIAQISSETSKDTKENSNEETPDIGKRVSPTNQPEQKVHHNTKTSKAAIAQDHTKQKERIDTSASELAHTDTVITIQQGEKTQQKEIQKKLTNSYRKEAIYSISAVIAAIAFTASATAAAFTQLIPLACLAVVALAVACICVYQLTQSHKDIHELKSKPKENIAHTFLEEAGLKIYSLIDKAVSKA